MKFLTGFGYAIAPGQFALSTLDAAVLPYSLRPIRVLLPFPPGTNGNIAVEPITNTLEQFAEFLGSVLI